MFIRSLCTLIALLLTVPLTLAGSPLTRGEIVYAQDGAGAGSNNAIFVVDPSTGARTILSQPGVVGTGADFGSLISGLAIDPQGQVLVSGVESGTLYRIDPVTGNRTIVSSDSVGSGPSISYMNDVVVAPNGDIYVTAKTINSVVKIDPITGNRTVVSGPDRGAGPLVPGDNSTSTLFQALSFTSDGGLLTLDYNNTIVYHIDIATGDRTQLWQGDRSFAIGPPLRLPELGSSAVEIASGDIVIALWDKLYLLDPTTHSTTELSGPTQGSGIAFRANSNIALDANGNFIVTDPAQGIFRVNPITGDRTLIVGDSVGSGPFIPASSGAFRDAVVFVPEVSPLTLLGVALAFGLLVKSRWKTRACRTS